MAHIVVPGHAVLGKQENLLLALVWHFGLACLLTALIFSPCAWVVLYLDGPLHFSYDATPWPVMVIATCITLVMVGKLLMDRLLAARWRAALLLLLIVLSLSIFVLAQAPLIPSLQPPPSFYYYTDEGSSTMMMSIYPCFFAALASAFLWERRSRPETHQKTGWLFLLLTLPAVLAGLALCFLATAQSTYPYDPPQPSSVRLIAFLYTVPTLLGVSLLGGFLGVCLYRWFQRAFRRIPALSASPAEKKGASTHLAEEVTSVPKAPLGNWAGLCWGGIWRLGLAGLISLATTGIVLQIRIYLGAINNFSADPFFARPLLSGGVYNAVIATGFDFTWQNWLMPISERPSQSFPVKMIPLFYLVPLVCFIFLLALIGVLVERALWKKHTLLPGLGITLIFFGVVSGLHYLVLALLEYLTSFWPLGIGLAVIRCGAVLCQTSTLALLVALALSNFSKSSRKEGKRLLWPLIGVASFVGSLFSLIPAFQQFSYYADDSPPFYSVHLNTLTVGIMLTLSLLLSISAAYLGGWLRSMLFHRLTD